MRVEDTRVETHQRLADRTTPLLRNYWYVAALSGEVDRTLRDRWILDESIVLFRKEDGTAVALQNRCGHRSFPLAKSRLQDDTIICGYHGIEYDASGRCIGVPCQDAVPSNLSVTSYAIEERAPFVWIWMGDRAKADPRLIAPELDFFANLGWTTAVHGYYDVKCNYLAMHENLLDLTHFPYLHGEKAGSVEYARSPFDVATEGDRVMTTRLMKAGTLARGRASALGIDPDHRVDQLSETIFASPALTLAHSTIQDVEIAADTRTVFRSEIVHALTPASKTETHYFWVNARNYAIDDVKANENALIRIRETFTEDVDALGWIEELIAREDRPEFHEISVRGDRAGLKMRSIVARLANEQR
jgi:vanillate O-demethylase monooxygenase subunit